MSIEKSNKLIAEFMGLRECFGFTTSCSGLQVSAEGYLHEGEFCILNELRYHASWDWLMPVVDRINSLNTKYKGGIWSDPWGVVKCSRWVKDGECYTMIHKPIIMNVNFETPLEAFYKTVVEFIQWYNKQ